MISCERLELGTAGVEMILAIAAIAEMRVLCLRVPADKASSSAAAASAFTSALLKLRAFVVDVDEMVVVVFVVTVVSTRVFGVAGAVVIAVDLIRMLRRRDVLLVSRDCASSLAATESLLEPVKSSTSGEVWGVEEMSTEETVRALLSEDVTMVEVIVVVEEAASDAGWMAAAAAVIASKSPYPGDGDADDGRLLLGSGVAGHVSSMTLLLLVFRRREKCAQNVLSLYLSR